MATQSICAKCNGTGWIIVERANVSGAFHMTRGRSLAGMRVLLVDDVVTTGATASACARVLKRAGAAHVALLALARTDRRTALELSFTAAGGGRT